MKKLFKPLTLLFSACVFVLSPAVAEERIEGRVATVDPGSRAPDGDLWVKSVIEVEIDGMAYPRARDSVRFLQEVPGVGKVEIKGDWVVAGAKSGVVYVIAQAGDVTPLPEKLIEPVLPSIGQSAVITSKTPFTQAQFEAGQQLFAAIAEGDLAALDSALAGGASPEVISRFGATPLAMAALEGNVGMVNSLVKAGANPNVMLLSQPLLSLIAVQNGTKTGVKALIDAGADVNAAGAYGFTPLHFAVDPEGGPGWLGALLLLEAGAEVDSRTGPDAPPDDYWGQEVQTSFDRSHATPLILASLQRDADAVRVLLARGADPTATNGSGQTAADLARAEPTCEDCLDILADPEGAAAALEKELVDEFERAITYLGDFERVKLLLEVGVDPMSVDEYGNGALHWLAYDADDELAIPETVALLLEAGVPVDDVSREGVTPLCLAAEDGRAEIVRLLLAAGANVGFVSRGDEDGDHAGITPLITAAAAGHAEVVQLLLAAGAKVNFQSPGNDDGDYAGASALMAAANEGQEDLVDLLLAAGANPSLKDAEGATAADYARARDYIKLAERLEVR